MNETLWMEKFIVDRFQADAQLLALMGDNFYPREAPEDIPDDQRHIIIQEVGGAGDVSAVGRGATRLLARTRYLVKAVGPAYDFDALAIASNHIDRILEGAEGTVTTGGESLLVTCQRERPVNYNSQEAGSVRFTHIGGFYRFIAS